MRVLWNYEAGALVRDSLIGQEELHVLDRLLKTAVVVQLLQPYIPGLGVGRARYPFKDYSL